MRKIPDNNNSMRLATMAVAMVLAVTAPLLVHAQSAADETLLLITGESKVTLRTSPNNVCTATTSGDARALAIALGSRCVSFSTSADIPPSLYVKIAPDRITFREEGKSYVVRDAGSVARARELFSPVRDLMQKQSQVGHPVNGLGARERDRSGNFSPARVSVPDLSAEFQKVEADAKRLSVEGGTQSELRELQSELSELQSRISELQSAASEQESRVSGEKSLLSAQMAAMSLDMQAMSEQIKVWSGQGEEAAEQTARQLKSFLDQAIASGVAKPE
ncbi:MAG TPA: hypothetical protein VGS59_03600 [Candidatus Acidoferrales bacterium]|nr:hypothetical protein [Candidatus Acidoferrales bacterium]